MRAFTLNWAAIQSLYDLDPLRHWQRCQDQGLACPFDPFEQLFWDHHGRLEFEERLRAVNWQQVGWNETKLSAVALRQVHVDRVRQPAVDEARARTMEEGSYDERDEVLRSWSEAGTWMRSPIIVSGDVMDSGLRYELLAGFTRLGNLFGFLDRTDILETSQHRIWLGQVLR